MKNLDFERFWSVYPKRKGANPRQPAELKFLRAVAGGADPELIIAGARSYGQSLREEAKDNTEYVAMATTWLNQKRWIDFKPVTVEQTTNYDAIAARHGYVWNGERYVNIDAKPETMQERVEP